MFACRLGKDLGKTLEEIFDMSVQEFQTWVAFYRWENKQIKKSQEKSRSR
jgi:predicted RNase H-like HicB family nuclease